MSYRSFKRVLGETHLERKCLLLFGICLLVLTAGSFWIYGSQTEKLAYQQNHNKGRLLVDTILTRIHWKAFQIEPEAIMMIDELSNSLQHQDYSYTTIKPNITEGKGQPQDGFDFAVLDQFLRERPENAEKSESPEKSESVEFQERRIAEEHLYHYYQAVRASRQCVDCHRSIDGRPQLAEGDLIAIVKVSISDRPVQAVIQRNNAILWATAIVTAFLLVVASYVIIRYVIVKPLRHLQEVSDAISHGDLEQRADINTGDEFEALGVAFNRMVRHLIAVQEELRQVNFDKDSKVDELAQVNMQLYEMNRLKGDFLATVSHELRTPLNSIIGFSDVLRSIDSLDDKQKRYVENIQKSGKVLLDMINDILDLAKIESGKMAVRLSDFRIDQIIAAQCDMARPLSEKKNIDLEVEIPVELPGLHQDQAKVQQILNNLLSNAIKFTPEGGRITIGARRDLQGDLRLFVSDTGVGIAEDEQTKIFEKFRQGKVMLASGDAMTREYSGTGLGLSIVKELCKLLGGEINVESELGRGSTFTVRLPYVLTDQQQQELALPASVSNLIRPRRLEVADSSPVSTSTAME